MKILFIANKAEYGGAPKCLLELIDQLRTKENVQIEVVTHGRNTITSWCDERGIKSYAVGHISYAIGKGSTPLRRLAKTVLTPYYSIKCYILNRRAFTRACEQIDFSDIDIIHTNSNRDSLGAMLAIKHNILHVWHLREFGKEDYDIRYLKFNNIKFMNNSTDYFIAISDAVRKAWIDKGIEKEKIYRIYDGINPPEKTAIDRAERYQNNTNKKIFKFAYLGIVCPGKGQLDAVKGLALVDKNLVHKIRIDFWGDYTCLPEFTSQIKKYAKEHGILDCISFRGFTNNIWDELPGYDGAMVCSRSEAFGRITPEYMSLGLQVIAANTGSNPELIQDGVSGYLYVHGNDQDLANKILMVVNQSLESRSRISANAKEQANMFTAIKNAEDIYDFYKKASHEKINSAQK